MRASLRFSIEGYLWAVDSKKSDSDANDLGARPATAENFMFVMAMEG
jgi:hypothetical protein